MDKFIITVKSESAAQALKAFLASIEDVENVHHISDNVVETRVPFTKGAYQSNEKPSDFAGIWKNKPKTDVKKLRQQAWKRKK
jgi:hypothetical protein